MINKKDFVVICLVSSLSILFIFVYFLISGINSGEKISETVLIAGDNQVQRLFLKQASDYNEPQGFYKIDSKYTVILSPNFIKEIKDLWVASGNNEYYGCIKGKIAGTIITLEDLDKVVTGSSSHIDAPSCSGKYYFGHIHKHPQGVYLASHADLHTNYDDYNKRGLILTIIHFEEDKINIKTQENWIRGANIII